MFCESFFGICIDNYYNTILPYLYLYYSNEYVSANLKGNLKKIGPTAISTVEERKAPFRKMTLALTVDFQRLCWR